MNYNQNYKNNNQKKEELLKEMQNLKGKTVEIDYDEKQFSGEIEEIYFPKEEDLHNGVIPGLIIKGYDEDGEDQYKHIKIKRINKVVDIETGNKVGKLLTEIGNEMKLM